MSATCMAIKLAPCAKEAQGIRAMSAIMGHRHQRGKTRTSSLEIAHSCKRDNLSMMETNIAQSIIRTMCMPSRSWWTNISHTLTDGNGGKHMTTLTFLLSVLKQIENTVQSHIITLIMTWKKHFYFQQQVQWWWGGSDVMSLAAAFQELCKCNTLKTV